ncbi:glucosaminidase domain-containing protein [Bacillus sp. DNRA2]|nr:glucosaminidase domain-containing protein [Bacillus sp. DNRA2]
MLTKIMLTNTITRNEKLRTQMSENAEFSKLFSNVLSQLLDQQNAQESVSTLQMPFTSTHLTPAPTENISELLNGLVDQNTANSKEMEFVTTGQLDQALSGKLAGMGAIFVAAGQKYDVDPALLAAIAQHETGNGKSRAANEKNNIAGMMGKNGLKSYATVEDSIMDMARNLSENYLGKGLTTIAKIGAKYAPIGVTNDPTGLNNYWVKGVSKYYDQLNMA